MELLLAVPMACEALSIGEFVAQTLADDPAPLPCLPQHKSLLLHCRKDFVERSIRMVQEQAAGLPALTELVVRAVLEYLDTQQCAKAQQILCNCLWPRKMVKSAHLNWTQDRRAILHDMEV